jgi:hypothetical protein
MYGFHGLEYHLQILRTSSSGITNPRAVDTPFGPGNVDGLLSKGSKGGSFTKK